VLNN